MAPPLPDTMRPHPTVILLAALGAAAIPGQQPTGWLHQVVPSVASRGTLLGANGTLFTRIDHDDYRGFCKVPFSPGVHAVTGVHFFAQDQDGSTPESFSLRLVGESRTLANYPDPAHVFLATGPFALPIAAAGPVAFELTVGFATAAQVAANEDLFIGFDLGPAGWPADGFTIQALLGLVIRYPIRDLPGAAPIAGGGYGLFLDPATGTLSYNTSRLLLAELLGGGPAGIATTVTNQIDFPISNTAPGTASFFSGLH
ncbi:MAG TPA: hypothetical protein VK348_00260, partial [Planctomycetota bacterium]|nr:hypothetical protein [Planctomycetota bacterium]